jgi:hypothetical protein
MAFVLRETRMPWLLILSIATQALLIIHCVKTGRNQIWIWVLALLSFPGAIANVAVEIVPDLFRSHTAKRTARGVKKALDPHADLRRYESEARVAGNVASRQRYAEALSRAGRFDEAISEHRANLNGLYEHDPDIMLGLARAQFGKGDASGARATLDDLIRLNPDFRSPEGHLLYARALEGEGNKAKALEEYRVVASSFPGAEATARFVKLLAAEGHREEARKVARELLEQARIAPAHYRRAQREWLEAVEQVAHS